MLSEMFCYAQGIEKPLICFEKPFKNDFIENSPTEENFTTDCYSSLINVYRKDEILHGSSGLKDTAKLFPDSLNKYRLAGVIATHSALLAGNSSFSYYLWYKYHSFTTFNFYNDNQSWLQMDKAAHIFSSYFISQESYTAYRWAGVRNEDAVLSCALAGFTYLLSIEILDGFSDYWGFSSGDLLANTAGCMVFASQQLLWNEQKVSLKYSYTPSVYAKYNPKLLGHNIPQKMLSDYNGISIWLSGNISSVFNLDNNFPEWLNLAIGYSGNGLGVSSQDFNEYRQFILSPDIDLRRIRTRSKVIKGILEMLSFIKIPSPSLEYNSNEHFKFHFLYF